MSGCGDNELGSLSVDELRKVLLDMKEPTGFVNRNDSIITFSNATRTLTIAPKVTYYDYYTTGQRHTVEESKSIQIPDVSGDYFFYLDDNRQLNCVNTFNIELATIYALVSYIYWSNGSQRFVSFNDERHGITLDGQTHIYLHTTRGAQLATGAGITYVGGTGSLNTDAQLGLGPMIMVDEDIRNTITDSDNPTEYFQQRLTPIAYIPIWYKLGQEWRYNPATEYPLMLGTLRPKYNYFDGTNWQIADAPANNKIIVTYIFGTTGFIEPVIGILGQAQYQNLAEAQQNASWAAISFDSLPSPEMKLLYTVFFEVSANYANLPNARIVYVQDNRYIQDRESLSMGASAEQQGTLLPTPTVAFDFGAGTDISLDLGDRSYSQGVLDSGERLA